ncbi:MULTISPECIES: DUF4097 family beta strand repeat-containing protein [unclassified Rathayibacter]|uniref:DUF4097 family beta strand repeat-containing protein n=1 Tax=unclassified Rathayibacter TaxID=2609250 RepID=UPI00188C87B9|nr:MULTISPECIES: DUF4097 family beta strand repeat-containing protein [unclassified Rathayibacter]MBF4463064.1 DUF4097 family beta strand repeat protein [Rathayibacter sp. VKM Ac-2879]MBF4504699.1 DUF4097 family beta strand repeat protein [Rathayibacter sp. VKM Ac-2878]
MSLEKWLVQAGETKVIDLDVIRAVKIALVGGQVDVIAHDEPTARVEVHSVDGRPLKVSREGDRLEIDHIQLRWDSIIDVVKGLGRRGDRADVSVLVPRGVALTFDTVSAEGLVSGLHSDARVSTVGGDVVLDGVHGDVEVNTVHGELSVRNHTGRVTARTVSGDVTATGALTRLTVDGVSGDVLVDAEGTPDEIQANTVSGDLTIRIDEGLGARYRINTATGTLQLDGSIVKGTFGRGYTATTGSLDSTWVDIAANSVSGDVTVVRRATSPAPVDDRAGWGSPDSGPVDDQRPSDGGAL